MAEKDEEYEVPPRAYSSHRNGSDHITNLSPYMSKSLRFQNKKGFGKTLGTRRNNKQNSVTSFNSSRSRSVKSLEDKGAERVLRNDSRNSRTPNQEESFEVGHQWSRSSEQDSAIVATYEEKVQRSLSMRFRFEQEHDNSMPLFHESGYPLATRSLMKTEIQTNSAAVNLTGGQVIHYQGILSLRITSKIGAQNKSKSSLKRAKFQKKIAVLKDGKFRLFTYPRGTGIDTGTHMLTESDLAEYPLEYEFFISNLRSIYYNRRGLKAFTLRYWKRTKELTLDGNCHIEKEVHLKAATGTDAEDWLLLFLLEAHNQALVFDNYAKILRKERKNNEAIISFLRMSVDLWSLAKGKAHPETKEAQLRLADWLIAHNQLEEGSFWEEYALRDDRRNRKGPLEELKEETDNDEVLQRLTKKMYLSFQSSP